MVKFPAEVENASLSNFCEDAFIEYDMRTSDNVMVNNFFMALFLMDFIKTIKKQLYYRCKDKKNIIDLASPNVFES